MEVAQQTVLLPSNRKPKVLPPSQPRRSLPPPSSECSPPALVSALSKSPMQEETAQVLKVEISEISRSPVSNGVHNNGAAQPMLTPSTDGEKEEHVSSISPNSQSGEVAISIREKKRKAHRIEEDPAARKSRVTRNRDDPSEVVNNYVDSAELKHPRRVTPPVGGVRIPFHLPKMDMEKEKDKLRINMVGPKPKIILDSMDEKWKARRKEVAIGVGNDFQAQCPDYIGDSPSATTSREDIEDRDEIVWLDNKALLKDQERDLDDAWTAVRRQFGGKIGLDAMLHRLMKCNYSIDEMLISIECEFFENLPQPFERLNNAQQQEFERLLRKSGNPNGKHREGEKIFRQFQEKFLKSYYLGEIVNYYYETKRRGCFHQLYTRCSCREETISDIPAVPRYECVNCIKYLWNANERSSLYRGSVQYCQICEIYNNRNRRHRTPKAHLTEPEEKIAIAWRDLEREKGKQVYKQDVLEHLENLRREQLTSLPSTKVVDEVPTSSRSKKLSFDELANATQKFSVKPNPKCSIVRPWGAEVNKAIIQGFTSKEKIAIVKAFEKCGQPLDFSRIAAEVGSRTDREISVFYDLYNNIYCLDKLITPPKKDCAPVGRQYSPSANAANKSSSPTPEPPSNRRKRAGSVDPAYDPRAEGPPSKTTRRTRQSTGQKSEVLN